MRVLKDHKLVKDDLWICGGVVIDPMRRFWEAHTTKEFAADEVIDGGGCIVAPGFVDLQINGGFGVDFSNPDITIQDVEYVSRKLLQHGCTSFLPTVVTSSPALYRKVLPFMAPRKSSLEKGAAYVLFFHVSFVSYFVTHSTKTVYLEHTVRDLSSQNTNSGLTRKSSSRFQKMGTKVFRTCTVRAI